MALTSGNKSGRDPYSKKVQQVYLKLISNGITKSDAATLIGVELSVLRESFTGVVSCTRSAEIIARMTYLIKIINKLAAHTKPSEYLLSPNKGILLCGSTPCDYMIKNGEAGMFEVLMQIQIDLDEYGDIEIRA